MLHHPIQSPLRRATPAVRAWRGCAAIVAASLFGHGPAAGAEPVRAAPPLRATLLDGRDFSLQQAAGKVLIVNFWVTWCGPCRTELPALDAFRNKYRDQGLEVLTISLDRAGDLAQVRQALRGLGLAAALAAQASFEGYGRIWRFPTTFVIDREGRLRTDLTAGVGPLDLPWLERHVAPLLAS